jgi:phosphate transport system permease protein
MAVAMLIGNDTHLNLDPFGLGATIPSVIAMKLPAASTTLQQSSLIQLGLVLFVVTVLVNTLARVMLWQIGGSGGPWFGRLRGAAPASTDGQLMPALRPSEARRHAVHRMNRIMTWVLGLCLFLTVLPLFHIFIYITVRGAGSLSVAFFTLDAQSLRFDGTAAEPVWVPPEGDETEGKLVTPTGLGHSLLGTTIMVILATLGAVPLGLLAALYLTEYRRSRLTPMVRFVGELLAGVPSIVVGIFAYALIVQFWGFSAYAGAFALAVLMVPTVMRASEEALQTVPRALRDASLALGATHSQTVWKVIVPSALPAIVTGIFLAMARIAGETAPLLFTANNSNYWSTALDRPMPFLTYYIYNYATSDVAAERQDAWAGAFVLLIFVILLNVGIRALTGRRVLQASRAG